MAMTIYEGNFDALDEMFDGLDFDDICKEALEECRGPLQNAAQAAIKASAHKGFATGRLASGMKSKPPKKSSNGAWILTCTPTGSTKHENGQTVSNAEIAVYLESGRAGQGASPWLAKTCNSCEGQAMNIIQKVFDSKVK